MYLNDAMSDGWMVGASPSCKIITINNRELFIFALNGSIHIHITLTVCFLLNFLLLVFAILLSCHMVYSGQMNNWVKVRFIFHFLFLGIYSLALIFIHIASFRIEKDSFLDSRSFERLEIKFALFKISRRKHIGIQQRRELTSTETILSV